MIDTMNKFMVGVQGQSVRLMRPPTGPIPVSDALLLAAYLVTMAEIADPMGPKFAEYLEAVQST